MYPASDRSCLAAKGSLTREETQLRRAGKGLLVHFVTLDVEFVFLLSASRCCLFHTSIFDRVVFCLPAAVGSILFLREQSCRRTSVLQTLLRRAMLSSLGWVGLCDRFACFGGLSVDIDAFRWNGNPC